MTIRVLHVIDHLGHGGAPYVVKNLVERLPADRIECTVCALRPNPEPLEIDAPVTTLDCHKYSPSALWTLARLCKGQKIDVVHTHLQKAIITSLLIARSIRARVVIHEHGPIFRGGTGCLYRAALRLLGARAAITVANSEASRLALEKALPTDRGPIVVVPNFIDLDRFDPERHDRSAARRSYGLADADFVVGFIGRLDRAKGADVLLDAGALLKHDGDSYRFVIVGDGPEKTRLAEQARALDLDDIVTFAGLCKDTASVMSAFDIGVVPSRREAFGIAALELMRMRIPVIASPVGGLPELVRDGVCGLLLARLGPEEISEAVRTLRTDEQQRAELVQRAFEQAGHFDGKESLERILEVYDRLAGH
jgi:glycosyltransferase involved in cell wall biosynthesis